MRVQPSACPACTPWTGWSLAPPVTLVNTRTSTLRILAPPALTPPPPGAGALGSWRTVNVRFW